MGQSQPDSDDDLALGDESSRLDAIWAAPPRSLDEESRQRLWASARRILSHGPLDGTARWQSTGLALGYVQSGKTTAITALLAAASDRGYRIIVALMGTTNILLEQNTSRIEAELGIGERSDYRWVAMPNPHGKQGAVEAANWLDRDRTLLLPVLKHAGRIRALADVLTKSGIGDAPVLIVDDEGDQASLNTKVNDAEVSRTYDAISDLRAAASRHLYVQFTATPYAPLLLTPDDDLLPEFVEMLQPGRGYTGGREFFVDHAAKVVRTIPAMDEQPSRGLPMDLPGSLKQALANFVSGTAMLLGRDPAIAPVSMLVHSTHKNDVQARYRFLIDRQVRSWARAVEAAATVADLPALLTDERARLKSVGAQDIADDAFHQQLKLVLREVTLWLVNSASDVRKVDWKVAPVHLLVGGNKLDRGFTVEGLTVTYLNRPTSPQIDTLEQRARAFGYRGDLLPFCQFFATPRTLQVLRDIVFTEYDLRGELEDWLDAGKSVSSWAEEIGIMLPARTKPTRDAVVTALSTFNAQERGWHSLRRPSLEQSDRNHNDGLVDAIGLHRAPIIDYGRLGHRTLSALTLAEVREQLLEPWATTSYSPGWRHQQILDYLSRHPHQNEHVPVLLMEFADHMKPRERHWDVELGFVNLFQGEDTQHVPGRPFYPGDRLIPAIDAEPDRIVVQVHRLHSPAAGIPELLTLAVYLGSRVIVRRSPQP